MSVARNKRVFVLSTIVGVIAVLAIASSAIRPRCIEVTGSERLTIPLSDIAKGAASFFCYRDTAGDRLRFVLARDPAGTLHAVLDRCRQCGQYHQGYAYSDGALICRFCGNRYRLKDMEAGKASCVPMALPMAQRGATVEIKTSDLERGYRPF
jgi:uncharacterized membrane protein